MKAARLHRYGGADGYVVEDAPDPLPGPRDLLVDVHASSVNPVDYKMRSGDYSAFVRWKLPWIQGMDLSGVVREVGRDVVGFAPGDEVWASPPHNRPGTWAEAIAVDYHHASVKPASLTHQEAASLPLVALTAWQSLAVKAGLREGQRVLIQAGSGGVGTAAIQLARHLGAHVIATCSAANAELVRSLGAHEVIDYRAQDWAQVLADAPVDVVLATLGGDELTRARRVTRSGGHIVSLTQDIGGAVARFGRIGGFLAVGAGMAGRIIGHRAHGLRVHHVTRVPDGGHLAILARLCDEGRLRAVVDRVFPLDDIRDAHAYLETGRARGKVVVSIR